ncbi:MAG: chromosome partitioning protein ParB [Cytophagaceae bacterium]|nr:MAG: chromosome partitioning protein ParB [Cytophagaceae bacterium]
MSDDPKPFTINVSALKSRPKDTSPAAIQSVDRAGEQHGFVARDPKGKPGRPPSPRTGQVHAKVLPHVAEEIAAEARRRGTQQGILIEEAWTLYLANKSGK